MTYNNQVPGNYNPNQNYNQYQQPFNMNQGFSQAKSKDMNQIYRYAIIGLAAIVLLLDIIQSFSIAAVFISIPNSENILFPIIAGLLLLDLGKENKYDKLILVLSGAYVIRFLFTSVIFDMRYDIPKNKDVYNYVDFALALIILILAALLVFGKPRIDNPMQFNAQNNYAQPNSGFSQGYVEPINVQQQHVAPQQQYVSHQQYGQAGYQQPVYQNYGAGQEAYFNGQQSFSSEYDQAATSASNADTTSVNLGAKDQEQPKEQTGTN